MRPGRLSCALACAISAAVPLVGCGSGGGPKGESTTTAVSRPAPAAGDFPATEGRSLGEVIEAAGPVKASVDPAATVFYTGANRYPFALFQKDGAPVDDAEVALYIAKVPKVSEEVEKPGAKGMAARARIKALEQPAIGPFPAAIETLATKPAFRARVSEPGAATVVYSTEVDFPRDGEWRIAAVVKEGEELTATLLPSAVVGEFKRVPRVGQRAPLIHTPTAADVGGDLSKLSTRVPPDTQNRVDYADAYGREPIILLFATPRFCQSRVCGPVVDAAEQVKRAYGEKAAFIHMEIFKDNQPRKGVNRQVRVFRLPTEPWLFAIDRHGRIAAEIEGAFGVEALTAAVRKAIAG